MYLECRPTEETMFNIINSYMVEIEINWEKCDDVCTDGRRAMTGKTAGVVARIKQLAPSCASSHCVLHRKALVA
jgi:hypothetical protein